MKAALLALTFTLLTNATAALAGSNGPSLKMISDFDAVATALQSAASEVTTAKGELTALTSELDETRADLAAARKANNQVQVAVLEVRYADKQSQVRRQAFVLTEELLSRISVAQRTADATIAKNLGPAARASDLADALAGRGLAGAMLAAKQKLDQFAEFAARCQIDVLTGDLTSALSTLGNALSAAKKAADGSAPPSAADLPFGPPEPDEFEQLLDGAKR